MKLTLPAHSELVEGVGSGPPQAGTLLHGAGGRGDWECYLGCLIYDAVVKGSLSEDWMMCAEARSRHYRLAVIQFL